MLDTNSVWQACHKLGHLQHHCHGGQRNELHRNIWEHHSLVPQALQMAQTVSACLVEAQTYSTQISEVTYRTAGAVLAMVNPKESYNPVFRCSISPHI
jgi:hypothetical protein